MTIPQPVPELEVNHIACVRCWRYIPGRLYVRVRDGLCRGCQRDAKGGNR